jgi:hypothetical protein
VKYFLQGCPFDLGVLTPVFQRWIQQHSVEGLLIDVADYKHVHNGPGIVLIGHEADYSFDLRDGHPGLLYTRKRQMSGSLEEDLRLAFRLAADAARKLEAEKTLNGVRFDYSQVEIMFLDRLNTPNTPEAFESVRGSLRSLAAALFNTEIVQVESTANDPRKPLTVRLGVVKEKVAGS